MKFMRTFTTKKIAYCAAFTALISVLTLFPRIPLATGYAHVGDAAIFLAALVLPTEYAAIAAGIGSMFADIISGYPVYAIPTLVIKAGMAAFVGLLSKKKPRLWLFGLILLSASLLMQIAYTVFDFFVYYDLKIGPALAAAPMGLLQTLFSVPLGLLLCKLPGKFVEKLRSDAGTGSPPAIHHPPSTNHQSPPAIHHPPSTNHQSPSTIYHPPQKEVGDMGLKVDILCKYGKYPGKDGGTSSFLVSGKDACVVLDMGSGAAIALDNVLPLEKVNAVVLSHLHYDHMCDILGIVYKCLKYRSDGVFKGGLPVYLPETPKDIFSLLEKTGAFDLRVIKDGESVAVGSMKLTFISMTHPVETYAVRIEEDGDAVAYTADTTCNENLGRLLSGSRLALVDACVLEKDYNERTPHISVAKISELAKDYGVKPVLIHLPHTEEERFEILKEARSKNLSAELGENGKRY